MLFCFILLMPSDSLISILPGRRLALNSAQARHGSGGRFGIGPAQSFCSPRFLVPLSNYKLGIANLVLEGYLSLACQQWHDLLCIKIWSLVLYPTERSKEYWGEMYHLF